MSDSQLRVKKISRRAENYFRDLCLSSHLIATEPDHDENGWDFLVEFPSNRLPAVHLDAQPSAIKFLCQVKATDEFSRRTIPLKISNWDHLIRTPLPAFIFVVNYNNEDEPYEVFLEYIGRHHISSTLKRIRELEADGDTDLHKHTMNLAVDESSKLSTSGASDFTDHIRKFVGVDLGLYTREKSELLSVLGYDEGRYSFTFQSTTSPADLTDAFLGLRQVEIENAQISSVRFGIPLTEHTFSIGTLSMTPISSGQCCIIASNSKRRRSATITGKLFGIPAIFSADHWKARISFQVIDVGIAPSGCTLKFAIARDTVYSLDTMISELEFLEICHLGGSSLHFQKDTMILKGRTIELDSFSFVCFKSLLTRLKEIRQFLDFSGQREDFKFKLENIYSQEEELKWIFLANSKRKQKITARLKTDTSTADILESGLLSSPIIFRLNDKHVIAFCYWDAKIHISNSKAEVVIRNCNVWQTHVMNNDSDIDYTLVEQEFDKFCERAKYPIRMARHLKVPNITPDTIKI